MRRRFFFAASSRAVSSSLMALMLWDEVSSWCSLLSLISLLRWPTKKKWKKWDFLDNRKSEKRENFIINKCLQNLSLLLARLELSQFFRGKHERNRFVLFIIYTHSSEQESHFTAFRIFAQVHTAAAWARTGEKNQLDKSEKGKWKMIVMMNEFVCNLLKTWLHFQNGRCCCCEWELLVWWCGGGQSGECVSTRFNDQPTGKERKRASEKEKNRK